MASRKKLEVPRNDALAVLTQIFGTSDGWNDGVAAAKEAAVIAEEVYALRDRHGLTQAALAALIDTSQSAIARMEDAKYRGHSMSVLRRIAAAVGEQVIVRFIAPTATGKRQGTSSKKRPARAVNPVPLTKSDVRGRTPQTRQSAAPTKRKKVTA